MSWNHCVLRWFFHQGSRHSRLAWLQPPNNLTQNREGKHLELLFVSETKLATYQESFRRAISLWIDHFFAKSSPRMVDSFTLSWPFIQMLIWRYPWKYIPQKKILAFLKSHGSIKRIFHHLLWGTYLFRQRRKSHAKSCSGVTSHNICVYAFGTSFVLAVPRIILTF